jgi:diguanylate cyclase (GGDEF)-like protein/PAS domain S-box-containing protein
MQIQAEAYLSALMESTEDLIWSVDLDDRLVTFNGALSRYIAAVFGVQLAAGMLPRDIVPPERANLLPPLYERARAEGSVRIEFPLADGRVLDLALNPILADGEATGVSVFGKDISKRKAAEGALREAERKYRSIFDGALEGIFQTTREGRLLTANPALAKMLGYGSVDELLSLAKNVGELIWAEPEERSKYLRQLEERGDCLGFECRLKRKDGLSIWASLNARRVCGSDGRLLNYEGFIIDITERKRAEQAQREIMDDLQQAQAIGALGSYALNIPTGVWSSSSVMDEIFGIGKEYQHDVLGWAALVHPADRAMMTAYFVDEVLGNGKAFDKEYRIIRQTDGAERWVHGMGRLDFDAQGKPAKMRGVIKDITERKIAEIQLGDSEERYRATFEQAPVGIVHTSFDGIILRCNSRFAEILGYPPEELPGTTVLQLTAPEDIPLSTQRLQSASTSTAKTKTLEKRYVRKDGALTWTKLTISIQRDRDGRPLHFITFVEDINDAKAAQELLVTAQQAVRASEERYRTVFDTSPTSIIVGRLSDGFVIDTNKTYLDLSGFERDQVIGHKTTEIGFWRNAADRKKMVDALLEGQQCRDLEFQSTRKNGELFWMRVSASLIEVAGCKCIVTFAQDSSESKAAEERLATAASALQLSEERYRTAFQTSRDAIAINRLSDGNYIDVNQAFLDITGYEREEVIGKTSLELGIWVDPRDRLAMRDMVGSSSSCHNLEVQFKKKDGTVFWGQMSGSLMEVNGVPCVLSVTRDLSESKAAASTIQSLAFYDPLTGLPNRRLLFERLGQILADEARSGRLKALLLIDLDNLKTLNDTLGHYVGDLLLKEIARRIVACARAASTVGRVGGDEFVVILDELSPVAEEAATQAKAVGEEVLIAISQPCLLENRECLPAASLGITVFGDHENTADEIMQKADIALHRAKAAGRNTLRFFSPALQAVVNAQAELENDLRQGIKAKQFLLYYQPQIERGRLTGSEALIRWVHPSRGLVFPDEFIPLAEETRLILPLGDWVLETACRQIAIWAQKKESAYLTVSVNISALQFRQPEFVERVLAIVYQTGANPKNLKLELTESMLVENFEEVIAKMTELKSRGLSFSLDDFGTGYSSLAYLKRLPLDQLKIDRAFVRDILVDVSSGAIAQTIISLGRAMDLSVVAEGVETEEQRGFLAGLGCHCFQGNLFSPPLPLSDFQAFL